MGVWGTRGQGPPVTLGGWWERTEPQFGKKGSDLCPSPQPSPTDATCFVVTRGDLQAQKDWGVNPDPAGDREAASSHLGLLNAGWSCPTNAPGPLPRSNDQRTPLAFMGQGAGKTLPWEGQPPTQQNFLVSHVNGTPVKQHPCLTFQRPSFLIWVKQK